jgi:cytoskeleton protein RodZ
MSSERADEPATPYNPHGIPGQALASQREAMGWTVEQVADQLKLQVRQVVALEAGDYASLPSPAVTRGFVRAYAKLMKMDPAPLVAQIAMETPPTPDSSATVTRRASPASFSESKFPSHGKRKALPLGWIVGGVVVVVAAAAAWHFGLVPHRSGEAEGPASASGTPAGTVTEPAAAGSAGSASGNGNAVETLQNPSVPLISVPGQNSGASAPATNGAAPAGNAPAPATAPAVPAPQPAAPAQAAPATRPAATPAQKSPSANAGPSGTAAATAQPASEAVPTHTGANALVLNVREDSWIQVTPAKGGAALISRLVKAGSTETVSVDQPVRVVVGNPDGVTATLRGNAVSLPSVPGKKLARINLQ